MKKKGSEFCLSGEIFYRGYSLRFKLYVTLFVVFAGFALINLTGLRSLSGAFKTSAQTVKDKPSKQTAVQMGEKQISVEALNQIKSLMDEKQTRTAAERKIDSNLLYALKMRRGEKIARNLDSLESGITVDGAGGVSVDIRAQVTDALLKRLNELKVSVTGAFPEYHSISAIVQIDDLEKVAELSEIIFIQPTPKGDTGRTDSANQAHRTTNLTDDLFNTNYAANVFKSPEQSASFETRARQARQFVTKQMVLFAPQTGSVTSQGDAAHQSNLVRSNLGLNGTNIKIGVISDGVRTLPDRQASGDLPANVTVLPGQAGSGDEGTAMLEIINDVAPGAQLYFATGATSITRYAQNYKDLRAAGCDIVLDDYFYFVETPFQDGQSPSVISTSNGGILAQAVSDVANSGAMVFALACNHGNFNDGFFSVYQSDFVDGGALALAPGGTVHDFGGGQLYDVVTAASGNPTSLFWSDPLGGSNNDYDLFVLNSGGTAVTRSSTNIQNGSQDPVEQTSAAVAGERIVVLKKTGAANRFFHLTIVANGSGRLSIGTEGSIRGHNVASNVLSVAAAPAAARAGGGTPGPFPGAFTSANVSERFTADGPRRLFFAADGTPFTPANFSSNGGILRQKPDITAADGVSTTTPGFTTFYGTSAATPHAGALAALIKSASPALTNAQITNAIIGTAIDIELPGYDRDTGNGIFMPIPALNSLGITAARAVVNKGTTVVSESYPNDSDGRVEPGEGGSLLIQTLQNPGAANATNVTATLSTTTPGVTVLSSVTLPFSDIAAGGTSAPNVQPYNFSLSPSFVCGTPIDFVLTVNYAGGGSSQQILNFAVDTNAATTVSSTLDTAAPPSGANYTAATGLQNLRINRAGGGSSCTIAKPFPGTFGTGTRRYDAYTFTATNSGCTTVAVNQTTAVTSTNSIFSATYGSGGFDPNNIGANFLADLGVSPELANRNYYTYAFNAVAGQQFTVVVNEVNDGGGSGVNYTVTVSGAPNTVCNAAPTAAGVSISGRVLSASNRGSANARVMITDSQNQNRVVVTNAFGNFRLDDLRAGETIIISVSSKRAAYNPQVVTLTENLNGLVFTPIQ